MQKYIYNEKASQQLPEEGRGKIKTHENIILYYKIWIRGLTFLMLDDHPKWKSRGLFREGVKYKFAEMEGV